MQHIDRLLEEMDPASVKGVSPRAAGSGVPGSTDPASNHRPRGTRLLPLWLAAAALGVLACGCGAEDAGRREGGAPAIVYQPHTEIALPGPPGSTAPAEVADPCVVKVGATWYLYGTRTSLDLEVWASEDLAAWRYEGVVWQPIPGGWNDQGSIWAPHVEATEQGYYLYYTANDRIGVAWASSPTGPFAEVLDGPFVGGGAGGIGDGVYGFAGTDLWFLDFEEFALDAFVLRGTDGSLTLYFAHFTPFELVSALPMVDYTTLAPVAPTLLLDGQVFSWEGLVREGPWVLEHEDTFHLMYSGNLYFTPAYGIGVATGAAPLGPFQRRADNPILATDSEENFLGPGHHCVVEGAFHDLLMFYHTKTSPEVGDSRRVRYVPVSYDGEGQLRLDVPPP